MSKFKRKMKQFNYKKLLMSIILICIFVVAIIKLNQIIEKYDETQQLSPDQESMLYKELHYKHTQAYKDSLLLDQIIPDEVNDKLSYVKLMESIITVESEWNYKAYNPREEALGWMQIRPILIKDLNRNVDLNYKLTDRTSVKKSISMFLEYSKMYQKKQFQRGNFKRLSRLWNGGPNGHRNNNTLYYWNKVSKVLSKLKNKNFDQLKLYKYFRGSIG